MLSRIKHAPTEQPNLNRAATQLIKVLLGPLGLVLININSTESLNKTAASKHYFPPPVFRQIPPQQQDASGDWTLKMSTCWLAGKYRQSTNRIPEAGGC